MTTNLVIDLDANEVRLEDLSNDDAYAIATTIAGRIGEDDRKTLTIGIESFAERGTVDIGRLAGDLAKTGEAFTDAAAVLDEIETDEASEFREEEVRQRQTDELADAERRTKIAAEESHDDVNDTEGQARERENAAAVELTDEEKRAADKADQLRKQRLAQQRRELNEITNGAGPDDGAVDTDDPPPPPARQPKPKPKPRPAPAKQ